MKKKVFIPERNNLNEKLIAEHPEIEIIDNPDDADFIIAQSTCRYPQFMHKTIYIAVEPPRSEHRIWCYNNFDNFKLVVCHNPDPSKSNQIPFTDDDSPQFYPTRPDPFEFYTREDTSIRNRGVFYAGMINIYNDSPDACGGINITPLRNILGEYFKNTTPFKKDSIIIGIGWDGQKKKVSNWREDKHRKIRNSKCDFVLALENTIYPNYLYEKIWDGFACDRVTMYLGDPRIEHHIPTNCFIDLRKFFNVKTKKFDIEGLGNYLKNMTQKKYDRILKNARKFRETAKGKHQYYRDRLTNHLIKYILNN